MPQVMPLASSRARAEEVYYRREVGLQPWSQIRDGLGFKSVGAAQQAYKRYLERNPMPNADNVAAAIVARKRRSLAAAIRALDEAEAAGDYRAVARLVDSITRADTSLAQMFGLLKETVDITVTQQQTPSEVIAEATERLLRIVDAEVVETPEIEDGLRRNRSGVRPISQGREGFR